MPSSRSRFLIFLCRDMTNDGCGSLGVCVEEMAGLVAGLVAGCTGRGAIRQEPLLSISYDPTG